VQPKQLTNIIYELESCPPIVLRETSGQQVSGCL
jgi:hypothetical protein